MFFGKNVRVLLKDQAKERFIELKSAKNSEDSSVFQSFNRKIEILKLNPSLVSQ